MHGFHAQTPRSAHQSYIRGVTEHAKKVRREQWRQARDEARAKKRAVDMVGQLCFSDGPILSLRERVREEKTASLSEQANSSGAHLRDIEDTSCASNLGS